MIKRTVTIEGEPIIIDSRYITLIKAWKKDFVYIDTLGIGMHVKESFEDMAEWFEEATRDRFTDERKQEDNELLVSEQVGPYKFRIMASVQVLRDSDFPINQLILHANFVISDDIRALIAGVDGLEEPSIYNKSKYSCTAYVAPLFDLADTAALLKGKLLAYMGTPVKEETTV